MNSGGFPYSAGKKRIPEGNTGVANPAADTDSIIAVNEYGFYSVPKPYSKREVPQVLLSGAVYEPSTLRLRQRLAGGGDIISGGAFIGDFFPALSRALARGARLHSFEPNPVSLAAAQETIALNGLNNVALHPLAVGETPGTLPLQIRKPHGAAMGARAKLTDAPAEGTSIDVEIATLDDLVPGDRKVTLLHLDIEGHEWPALLGTRRIITDHAPTLIVEAAKPHVQRGYLRKLGESYPEQGYVFAGSMERNAFFRPGRG